jgi:hypothetical protein
VPASAASAAPRHVGWLASAQDDLKRGAQAARVAMGQAPQADPSVRAAIVPGEAAGVATALSPPDVLPAPAPAPAKVVAILPVEPPVASDAGMAKVPLLEVVSDLPSLGHKEGAAAVAEVGDRKPASSPCADCRGSRRLGGGARRTAARFGERRPHPRAVRSQ